MWGQNSLVWLCSTLEVKLAWLVFITLGFGSVAAPSGAAVLPLVCSLFHDQRSDAKAPN